MADPKQPSEKRPIASSLEEFRYIQQVYQNQYMALVQEISARAEYLRQLDNVQKALEELDTIKERPTLIPMGADTFVNGRITSSDSVVLGVGAGYFVEKDIASAKSHVSKALESETNNINKLNKSKKEIEAALVEISYKIEELSR